MMLTVFIICVLVVWVARLLLVPYAKCRVCAGTGTNQFSGRKRHGDCWRCKGAKRRRVLGAKTAHQMWLAWRGRGQRRGWGK
jgi:hypothetical protein